MVDAGEPELLGGKYRIVSVLGKGAMGVVYRAEQLDAEGQKLRDVALKMIQTDLSVDPAFARRFLREVRIAARLSSPYIVAVYDAGSNEAGGQLYYTMELVRGPTLREVLEKEGRLSPARAVEIAAQIAEALAEAQSGTEPVVHRDLKPPNVFLETRHGRDWVKVNDFGIAKVIGDEQSALTAAGSSIGTPRYMAPEQWRGEGVDVRADLYSLGVILYECLAGAPPFSGSLETLMYKHLNEAPPPLPASLPEPLRALVGSLLAKDPAERPADALALRRLLDAPQLRGGDDEATALLDAARDTAPTPGGGPRHAGAWVAGVVAVAAAAGVLMLFHGRAVDPPPGDSTMRAPTAAAQPRVMTKAPPAFLSPPTVAVVAPPIAPTAPRAAVEELACDRSPPSRDEAEHWIEAYRRALEARDVARLRDLGAARGEDVEAVRAKLAPLRDYRVEIGGIAFEVSGREARIRFDRNDRWKDPENPSFVFDYEQEARTLVHRSCRVIATDGDSPQERSAR